MSADTAPPGVATTSALARHLGLSRWTVSRVLNGHPGVRPDTVARVRAAMDELGFTPDPLARGLRGTPTGAVGVCFSELESPILARKTATLQRLLREAGLRSLIELTNGEADLEAGVVRHFLAVRVEAVVLLGSTLRPEDAAVTLLRRSGVPVVTIDPEHRLPFTEVALDRPVAMMKAVEHLCVHGHRRLALFGLDPDNAYGAARWQGLRQAARHHGLSLKTDVTRFHQPGRKIHDYAYGTELAGQFLRSSCAATAIVAVNDRVALGAIHRLRAAGVDTPRDVSVVGYDNLDVGSHVAPELTTIDQQVDLMMRAATSLLLDARAGGSERQRVRQLIQPVLVARGSVARPRTRAGRA